MTGERNFKLTIEYDGTSFHGWQRQAGLRTVEGVIEERLAGLIPGEIAIQGASRTDRGVHALGQVANFSARSPIPTERLLEALNGRLPPDIRVRRIEEADAAFSARFSATGKHYRYWIDRGSVPGAFSSRYALHVPGPLDLEAMRAGAAQFAGERDFAAYQCASKGPPRETIRTIHEVHVNLDGRGRFLVIDVLGKSFLYKMVRTMVGTLLEIGRGKSPPERVAESLETRDRSAAGPTAPPQGLFLVSVSYHGAPSRDGVNLTGDLPCPFDADLVE